MTKRIFWKKGMRLTDEVLTLSDRCTDEQIARVLMTAASGQFGLMPTTIPFEVNVNPTAGFIEVEALACLGVTKAGDLLDIKFDTRYANAFDTRVLLPDAADGAEYILTVQQNSSEWREVNDGLAEPLYTFTLITNDAPLSSHALPIAKLVNQYGWHIDEEDFVPPCLLISAHPKFMEQYVRTMQLFHEMESRAHGLLNTDAMNAMRIFWPLLQQVMIETDKERDVLSPMALLAKIQRVVGAFTCACELDDYLELADADIFRAYSLAPYNYKDVYNRIREGLEICSSIRDKLDKMKEAPVEAPPQPAALPAPEIAEVYHKIGCASGAKVPVICHTPGAAIFFTLDGSEPSNNMLRTPFIPLSSGFSKQRTPEPEKIVTIKMKAVKDGISSPTVTYQITLWKDFNKFSGPEI
ncbi:MAG: chitobiase/beta-hexosaminidase C-terminal domain-containing protein [Prevotella sp.]|nr:chitobiase/beta-hexosaminidase C-terminal domain-containing protein [Prevotella sp.]